jgi:tyrosine-protein kinase Etk/Wzc
MMTDRKFRRRHKPLSVSVPQSEADEPVQDTAQGDLQPKHETPGRAEAETRVETGPEEQQDSQRDAEEAEAATQVEAEPEEQHNVPRDAEEAKAKTQVEAGAEEEQDAQRDPEETKATTPVEAGPAAQHDAPRNPEEAEAETPVEAPPEVQHEAPRDAEAAGEQTKVESAPASTTPAPLTLRAEDRARPPIDAWDRIPEMVVDADHLRRNRIICADRLDPAHASFDVLRTRILHALQKHGWRRVALTSPGKGCGKTFTAANLAISLSRQETIRTVLMDLDLRRPNLHRVLGVNGPGALGDVLRGRLRPEDHLLRMGPNTVHAGRNIAFALNTVAEPYASEPLQDPRCADALDRMERQLAPDVMLFDLPPALVCDDVIAMRPLFDAVLLVVGGGLTTDREVKEVERRLGADTPLLGMVLNKADGAKTRQYTY